MCLYYLHEMQMVPFALLVGVLQKQTQYQFMGKMIIDVHFCSLAHAQSPLQHLPCDNCLYQYTHNRLAPLSYKTTSLQSRK